jgi:hypothetical protein
MIRSQLLAATGRPAAAETLVREALPLAREHSPDLVPQLEAIAAALRDDSGSGGETTT